MKCPKCQNDHKKKQGSICSSCHYSFIFKDPKAGFRLSDNAFGHLLKKVSANGTRHYLTRHVQAAIALRPKKKTPYVVGTIIFTVALTVLLSFAPLLQSQVGYNIIIASIIVIPISILIFKMNPDWPSERDVQYWLKEWQSRFGPLEFLITEKKCDDTPTDDASKDHDIESYGVQKILIVDEDLFVDFLVLNHWHTDQQTLVVSQTGYPASALKLANQNLSSNPELNVFLYHSSEQENFAEEVRNNHIFNIDQHNITSLGISTEMIQNSKYFKKHFKNIPKGVVHADQIPANTSLGVLTATMVGGALFADMLDEEVQRHFEANLQSNFG